MAKVCTHQPAPTAEQKAAAAEIRENGGSLTADDLAHSGAFSCVGVSWSRAAANRSIKQRQAEGKWSGAHAHADGSIYLPREEA
jgi:hypothetical protein